MNKVVLIAMILLTTSPLFAFCPVTDDDMDDFEGSMASKSGEVEVKLIHITFPDMDPPHYLSVEQDSTLGADFSEFIERQSLGDLILNCSTIDNPADPGLLWEADSISSKYSDIDSVSTVYSTWWHPGGELRYQAELQAEILNMIWDEYTDYYGGDPPVNPFDDTDWLVFVLHGPLLANSPLGDWIDGNGYLMVKAGMADWLSGVDTNTFAQVDVLSGITFNWYDIDKAKMFISHEFGHSLGLRHTHPSVNNPSSYNEGTYQFGNYSCMRAESMETGGCLPFIFYNLSDVLEWYPAPNVVSGSTRDVVLQDFRLSKGECYKVPIDSLSIDYGSFHTKLPQYFYISYHGGHAEDAEPDSLGLPLYRSKGLAVWHCIEYETPALTTRYIDLESSWGRYLTIGSYDSLSTWSNPSPEYGYDNLDPWPDPNNPGELRDYNEYSDYQGSKYDFFSLSDSTYAHIEYPGEFSYRTNPSTYGARNITDEEEKYRIQPQSEENSIVFRITKQEPDSVIVDILYAPYENITHPNGGEAFVSLQPLSITWEQEYAQIDTVDIYFSDDDGESYSEITAGLVNSGSYAWTPQDSNATDEGRIKIVYHNTLSDSTFYDESDSTFTIFESTVAVYDNQSDDEDLGLDDQDSPYSSVVFDQDGDGLLDYFVAQKSHAGVFYEMQLLGQSGVPQYDKQNEMFDGDPPTGLRGVSSVDFDNDGDEDLFVAHRTDPRLYMNADSCFVDMADSLGVSIADSSWAGVWGDYDRDGWVDLYVCRAGGADGADPDSTLSGVPDILLRNRFGDERSGVFVDVSDALDDLQYDSNTSIAASWADYDQDGDIDLIVPSLADGEDPRLFVNQDDGSFEESFSGLFDTVSVDKASSVVWADIDSDGEYDLAMSNQAATAERPFIFTYDEQSDEFVDQTSLLPATGEPTISVHVLDHDLDGHPDLLMLPEDDADGVTRLFTSRVQGPLSEVVFFDETSTVDLDDVTGRVDGASVADVNLDGDPDLLLGRPEADDGHFYRAMDAQGGNSPSNNWVGVKLVGDSGANNASGIGAIVTFEVDDPSFTFTRTFTVDGGSSRGGQSPKTIICGVSSWTGSVDVTVIWPGKYSQEETVSNKTVLQIYDETDPQIQMITKLSYSLKPGRKISWDIEWRTNVSCDPTLDCVTIDGPGIYQTTCAGNEGVLSEVSAIKDGGYRHSFSFDTTCDSGIYDITVRSKTKTQAGTTAAGADTVSACLR